MYLTQKPNPGVVNYIVKLYYISINAIIIIFFRFALE